MNRSEHLEDFREFCRNATNFRLREIYRREAAAGRSEYTDAARDEIVRREQRVRAGQY